MAGDQQHLKDLDGEIARARARANAAIAGARRMADARLEEVRKVLADRGLKLGAPHKEDG